MVISSSRHKRMESTVPPEPHLLCELFPTLSVGSTTSTIESSSRKIDKSFPLHDEIAGFSMQRLLIGNTNTEERMRRLLYTYPESAQTFDSRGYLPLHVACREGASLAFIRDLIKAWPEAVQTRTRDKAEMFPLHLACRYFCGSGKAKTQVLSFLMRLYPAAVEAWSASGDMALHEALQNYFCTLQMVQVLVQAYPEALNLTNEKGQLPLHVACERQYMEHATRKTSKRHAAEAQQDVLNSCDSGDVIRLLARSEPLSLTRFNERGELPLLTAIRGYQSTTTIRFLLSAYPEAIEFIDDYGRSALHLAVRNEVVNSETVKLILMADPSAVDLRDDSGHAPRDYWNEQLVKGCPSTGVDVNVAKVKKRRSCRKSDDATAMDEQL